MKRGRIHVAKEIMQSPEWPAIEEELSKVFTLEAKEQLPYGVIALHGTSDLFDESKELESPQYEAVFTCTRIDDIYSPKFKEFVRCQP